MTEQHNVIGVDTANPSSASNHKLGELAIGGDGTEWVYVACASAQAITQYDVVTIDENYEASPVLGAALDDGHAIGFAQAAFTKNQFGWVAKRGSNINARLAANCAADVELYATATAGVLDDAVTTATELIKGVVAVAGSSTTAVKAFEVLATWPRTNTPGGGQS